jgi:hypothetical protein
MLFGSATCTGPEAKGDFSVSRKNPDPKIEAPISEAAEKAELLIRGLQSRLAECAVEAKAEPTENLEWELERYFATETSKQVTPLAPLQQIRKRVVEGVAEKILNGWEWSESGKTAPLENEVIERLVERVFERLIETHGELPQRPNRTLNATKSPVRQVSAPRFGN